MILVINLLQNILASKVAVVRNLPASVGDIRDASSIPGLGKSPGGGNDNPLPYSFLENYVDRGAWWATVHGVAKSQTQLSMYAQSHADLVWKG